MDSQSCQNAKKALKAQDYKAAERDFKKVLHAMTEDDEQYSNVLSHNGMVQVLNADENGLFLCREAASNERVDAEVFLNLACAEWYSNNRKRAIEAISQGLKIDSENQRLSHACSRLDCRKKCCFSFLSRSHKLNRLFGRLMRRTVPEITVHSLLY